MTAASDPPSLGPNLRLEPAADRWPVLANRATNDERAKATRSAMGLDPSRPVIMSGHQPALWHPGILAKRFALTARARALDAQPVWLVVDQDAVDPWAISVPITGADASLAEAPLRLAPPPPLDTPACAQPATTPQKSLPDGLRDDFHPRIDRAVDALAAHADQPSAARQFEHATASILNDNAQPLFASELYRLPGFGRIIERMRHDPALCAQAYNHAVRSHGGARPLDRRADDWELPLWKLDTDRSPVFASELASIDPAGLAPRALLMTLLLRLEACDLFIHGTGGGATGTQSGYDRATEAWAADWLHERLCPAVVVSADLRLDLGQSDMEDSEADLQRTVNRAHTARHNPALVGDDASQTRKCKLVRTIEGTTDRFERAELYRELQALLDEHRESRAAAINELESAARSARGRVAGARVAANRDWSFVLYPDSSLEALRKAVEAMW